MTASSQPMVTFRIDGRTVQAPEGTFVLDVARDAGIDIPTLCNHPDLEPVGACRVCMVEVTHPDWNGWSGLMTSCLYPVKEGIEVSTRGERVKSARRGVLSLLAARCPNSKTIRALADEYGARADGLTTDPDADSCILCGLCTRVCETYATGAITTAGRGALKRVATFAEAAPADCVGCGACVSVCPTGELTAQRTGTGYRIWNRTFPTAICQVDEDRCVGCGSCEEACPFSVARIALRAGAEPVAVIPTEHCRGCGACVGACPSGAITQVGLDTPAVMPSAPARDVQVFACARSNLSRLHDDAVRLTELPCAGRVTLPMLLSSIASGAKGVIVAGRHQRTCRFNGAEDPVRDRVQEARHALDVIGLEPERIQFVEPLPGPDGPADAVRQFQAAVAALPNLTARASYMPDTEGLDDTLAILDHLASGAHANAPGRDFLKRHGLPPWTAGKPAILAGVIPRLHVLGRDLLSPVRLDALLQSTIAVLSQLGIDGAGVAMDDAAGEVSRYTLEPRPGEGVVVVDPLLCERGARLPRPPHVAKVATDGSREQRMLVEALGYEPVDVGPDPLPSGFTFSRDARRLAAQRLVEAEKAGSPVLLATDPKALARWALLTRQGAWKSSRVLPVLGIQLAHLAVQGVPLARRSIEAPAFAPTTATEVVS